MEILNFISHSNYNITIYVKENTIVKMTKLRNFYLDFPSLTITTYSSSELTPTRSEIQVFYFKNEAFKIFSISQIYFIYFLWIVIYFKSNKYFCFLKILNKLNNTC